MKFPQYRRYTNRLSYFRIISLTEFEEIKIVGKKKIHSHIIAKHHPERVFIHDLLFNYKEFAEEIVEGEWLKSLE